MRLGSALLAFMKINKIPYKYRGKNRTVKKPSMHDLLKMKQDFEREEQNMLILRYPYLTIEQSFNHTKALNKKDMKYLESLSGYKHTKFQKEVTFIDHLSHLRVSESWD